MKIDSVLLDYFVYNLLTHHSQPASLKLMLSGKSGHLARVDRSH